ncbi:MAG TPA: hypothetical protein VNU19_06205 [Candidatus Acidoferrum sp.]|nr:hypothetical protein [Candidatus Acidoferrum sp.]
MPRSLQLEGTGRGLRRPAVRKPDDRDLQFETGGEDSVGQTSHVAGCDAVAPKMGEIRFIDFESEVSMARES